MTSLTFVSFAAQIPSLLTPQNMLLLGGLLLVAIGTIAWLRTRRKFRALEPTSQEKVERMRQMRGMRGDLEGLMVEIEQMTKRLGAQLDAKAIHLERLIAEADERIARFKDAPQAQSPAENADPIAPPTQPDDPLARSVYALADQGLHALAIAKQINQHVGKVELILALRTAGSAR